VLLALAVLAVISNWPRGVDYPWTGRPRIKEATGLSCHEGDARRSVATVQSPVASLVRTEWRGAENAAVAYGQCFATVPVNFPLRVILALVVIGAFAGVGGWGVVAVLKAKRLTESQRMIGVGGIVLITALLVAWVVFLWPTYWD